MKATYKRYLAAAFATVGLVSLGVSQVSMDPLGPSQSSVLGSSQTPTNSDTPDQSLTTSATTTDLGTSYNGAPMMLDTSNAPRIIVNGTEVNFTDCQPGLMNGQLMIPIRAVSEQIGANVQWANLDKQVTIDLPTQQTVTLNTNQQWLSMLDDTLMGRAERFSTGDPDSSLLLNEDEVVLIDNHAYMPFDQFVSEINGSGDWDRSAGTATITVNSVGNGEDFQTPDKTPPPDFLPPKDDMPEHGY